MMKKLLIGFVFFILCSPAYADQTTGLIETFSDNGTSTSVLINTLTLNTSDQGLSELLFLAFEHSQELSLVYSGTSISSVSMASPYQYQSLLVSFFIGAVSAGSFALAFGAKLS